MSVFNANLKNSQSAAVNNTASIVPHVPLSRENSSVNWEWVQSQFTLRPDFIYMNSGSEGSMPRFVIENLNCYNKGWAQDPSYSFFTDPTFGEYQTTTKAIIGDFIGTSGNNICITNNTTMGLGLCLMGIDFNAGDEIITTDQEHYSLLSPLTVIAKRRNVKIITLRIPLKPVSKEEIVVLFKNACNSKTKALCFSDIAWTTGIHLPVTELCGLADELDIVSVVDGAQSLGVMDCNLTEMGCDFFASSGHKWLNGPPGTGILYIKDAERNPWNLWPIISEYGMLMESYPISTILQIRGCNNTPSFRAMADSISFEQHIGKSNIAHRILTMSDLAKQHVISLWGSESLFSPIATQFSSGFTAFVPSIDTKKRFDESFIDTIVSRLLIEHNIYVRKTMFPDYSCGGQQTAYVIRISTNIFNSLEQIDTLFSALKNMTYSLYPIKKRRQ